MIFWIPPLVILIFSIYLCRDKFFGNTSQSQKHLCFICEDLLNNDNSFFYDEKAFCNNHIDIYKNCSWTSLHKLTCYPDKAEEGVLLYEFKLDLIKKQIDAYIVSDYEVRDEEVLTTMEIFVLKEKKEEAQRLLPKFN